MVTPGLVRLAFPGARRRRRPRLRWRRARGRFISRRHHAVLGRVVTTIRIAAFITADLLRISVLRARTRAKSGVSERNSTDWRRRCESVQAVSRLEAWRLGREQAARALLARLPRKHARRHRTCSSAIGCSVPARSRFRVRAPPCQSEHPPALLRLHLTRPAPTPRVLAKL